MKKPELDAYNPSGPKIVDGAFPECRDAYRGHNLFAATQSSWLHVTLVAG